jgi:hypothetical protein
LLNGEREYDRNSNKTKKSVQDECMEHESQVGTAIKNLTSKTRNNDPAMLNAEELCMKENILDKCGDELMDMCNP